MPVRVPKYRLHRASGQALVQIDGRRTYLGKYDTPESRERYNRMVATWLHQASGQPQPAIARGAAGLSVNELVVRYFNHAQAYYVRDGKPTKEVAGGPAPRGCCGCGAVKA